MPETSLTTMEMLEVTAGRLEREEAELMACRHDRLVLIRRAFDEGVTQATIGKVTGLTRQRIQQICGKDGE